MNGKKKTMRAVIEIIIAVLVIIAVYFIIRGMDRHDVCIRQAATENETQRVWKEFQEKPVSIKLHKKTWKFAHPVQTYLFIGTDKSGNEDAEGEEYHGSMADALMLVVVDKEEKTYGILQLNRDTITEVPMLCKTEVPMPVHRCSFVRHTGMERTRLQAVTIRLRPYPKCLGGCLLMDTMH